MLVFYEDVSRAMQESPTKYNILIGDFNAKLGSKEDGSEFALGHYGYGERNDRGTTMLQFLLHEKMYAMNSFFKKKPQRKWTWHSPDGNTKNEIDYIITNKQDIVQDVTVINKCSIGSDHRMVRAKVNINIKRERRKLISQTHVKKWTHIEDPIQYQQHIDRSLGYLKEVKTEEINIDELNKEIIHTLKMAQERSISKDKTNKGKLSKNTKDLMTQRRVLRESFTQNQPALKQLDKNISKAIRKDIRKYNTDEIIRVIEKNKDIKILNKNLYGAKKNICKLADQQGNVTSNREEILKVVEHFYKTLYGQQNLEEEHARIPRIQNQGSEDIPEVTISEVENILASMKNNRASGEDQIIIEAIKASGKPMVCALQKLFNACISKGTTPTQWNNAVIILIHKKGDITNLANYRPISLLSHIYKLFMRVITQRLTPKLDFYQAREQTGFGTGGLQKRLRNKRPPAGRKGPY